MKHQFDFEIEDYRIYFVIGASCLLLWIALPFFQGWVSIDFLVVSNAWLKVGGQLLIAGVGLSLLPSKFKFLFLVFFAIYLTGFTHDVLASKCDLAGERFVFNVGEMPRCLFTFAI